LSRKENTKGASKKQPFTANHFFQEYELAIRFLGTKKIKVKTPFLKS